MNSNHLLTQTYIIDKLCLVLKHQPKLKLPYKYYCCSYLFATDMHNQIYHILFNWCIADGR